MQTAFGVAARLVLGAILGTVFSAGLVVGVVGPEAAAVLLPQKPVPWWPLFLGIGAVAVLALSYLLGDAVHAAIGGEARLIRLRPRRAPRMPPPAWWGLTPGDVHRLTGMGVSVYNPQGAVKPPAVVLAEFLAAAGQMHPGALRLMDTGRQTVGIWCDSLPGALQELAFKLRQADKLRQRQGRTGG